MSMATLQTSPIDDAGTQLAYIDSGPPPTDTYTTLVIVHGHTYHAHIFSRLLPIAHTHNLRVIALNRRDYVGSTLFSADELAVINSEDDEAHTAFLQARGLEIARFLVWVIRQKHIPRASVEGNEGGLALLGWSLGNLTTMAFLRHLKSYPAEIVEALEPYLKTFYIYECGSLTLGYPSPQGAYHPLSDASVPPRMRGVHFGTWVSTYFRHPYYSRENNLKRDISSLQVLTPKGSQVYRPCTFDTLKPDELVSCVDPGPPARSEQPFMATINRTVMYDQTLGGLLLDHVHPGTEDIAASNAQSATRDAFLPDITICVLYGDASVWSVTWCVWELEKDLDKWDKEGRKHRPCRFQRVEGANHFLHWDDPERFLQAVNDGLGS